jgi:hypothetical protein
MGRSVSTPRNAESVVYSDHDIDDQDLWDEAIYDLKDALTERFPSLSSDTGWIDREDRIIASNRMAYITVSEYCGVVAVCAVPRDADNPLHVHWASSIEGNLTKCVKETFGHTLRRLGTMSNGEGVYQRA